MPRSVDHFISSQFRAWTEKEREKVTALPLPLITISREYGALGARLAQDLAGRFNLVVWDQELLTAIAEKTGAEERFLASLDERRRGAIDDLIEGAILGNAYMRSEYLQALMGVLHTIASHGAAIIVGRGANYVLPPESCLRLRIVRPLDDRVADIAERRGLSEKEARSFVTKRDKSRQVYLRQNFKRDGTAPADYDLVLNTGVFNDDQRADIVEAAYRAKFGQALDSQVG